MKAKCPECEYPVWMDFNNEVGDVIYCDNCNAVLEIIRIEPIKVRLVEDSRDEESLEDEEDVMWEE